MISTYACADWVREGKNALGTSYYDNGTIRKNGSTVKMWTLFDYIEPQLPGDGNTYLSKKIQTEYDCNAYRTRSVFISVHTESMAKGKVIFTSTDPTDWDPILPESLADRAYKKLCAN